MIGLLAESAAALKAFFAEMIVPAVIDVGKFIVGVLVAIAEGMQAILHGPEAIIPLNARRAGFMRDVFGGGESAAQRIEIPIYLEGYLLARVIADRLLSALRSMGTPSTAFTREALGTAGNGGGKFHQTIILDGKVLAQSVFDRLPTIWRVNGMPG